MPLWIIRGIDSVWGSVIGWRVYSANDTYFLDLIPGIEYKSMLCNELPSYYKHEGRLTVTEKDLKQIAPVTPDSGLFLFQYQPLPV